MSHTELTNSTPYACELLFLLDEMGMPVCVPVVQATFGLTGGQSLALLEQQPAIDLAGRWWGDPAVSSMRLEPQIAFVKPATDIVLLGHAYPANRERSEGMVGIRVGSVQKTARVFGNRRLITRNGIVSTTPPEPFERIPLRYEYAFGGWDRHDENPDKHTFEARNPVGSGYRADRLEDDEILMPNLEDPADLYDTPSRRPAPAGFGFVAPDWQPRAGFAGTYDQAWNDTRKPLLPGDFDRRFFNAASPGLIAPSYLRGDEWVTVIGASPDGRVDFQLPGMAPPECRLMLNSGAPADLRMVLDTLVTDMDQLTVTLTWRAHLTVPRGVHDVAALELPPQPPSNLDDDGE